MTANDEIVEFLNRYPTDAAVKRWPKSKPGGNVRYVAEPSEPLSYWLTGMNKILSRQFNSWPSFMHGGIKGRSYVSYARQHVNKPYVITIDIKKCFDSIREKDVADNIKCHLNLHVDISRQLAHALCYKGRIAQGFPTSNFTCNLYLLGPLSVLHESLKKQKLWLGNYVDDLAVSGPVTDPAAVINHVALTLSKVRLQMSKGKVQVMPSHKRQIVCGLLVNSKLSLTKDLKKELFSNMASGEMSSDTAKGWIANLKNVDSLFQKKFFNYAVKKGLIN